MAGLWGDVNGKIHMERVMVRIFFLRTQCIHVEGNNVQEAGWWGYSAEFSPCKRIFLPIILSVPQTENQGGKHKSPLSTRGTGLVFTGNCPEDRSKTISTTSSLKWFSPFYHHGLLFPSHSRACVNQKETQISIVVCSSL